MMNPYYYPCALVICDGKQKGPKYNKTFKGMLVAEPKDLEGKLKKADLLDFDYDSFDYRTTPYAQGVQHWPFYWTEKENKKLMRQTGKQTEQLWLKQKKMIFYL